MCRASPDGHPLAPSRSPVWLGPDLLASVSRIELEKIARCMEIGPGAIRLEASASDFSELEEILMPILPRAAQVV